MANEHKNSGRNQMKSADLFPHASDVQRTCFVAQASGYEGEIYLCGRLREWDEQSQTGELADWTGAVPVTFSTANPLSSSFKNGDLVEAKGRMAERVFKISAMRKLVARGRKPRKTWRWVEMIKNPKEQAVIRFRSAFLNKIRQFFLERDFIEIDAHALVSAAGMEPHIEPFQVSLRLPGRKTTKPLYLHTSPEFTMKKMLVAGFEKIFFLGHAFRNGEISPLHSPEFTMLEWYRAYSDYTALMEDCQNLVRYLWRDLSSEWGTLLRKDDLLQQEWHRQSLREIFQKKCEVTLSGDEAADRKRLLEKVQGTNLTAEPGRLSTDDLFFLLFLNKVEPELGKSQPTFLMDYPVWMASLARRSNENPGFVERFELYIDGLELANAFTELNDWREQFERFRYERNYRKKRSRQVIPVDEEFMDALRYGMPPAAGIALGVDRLMMVFTNIASIGRTHAYTVFSEEHAT